MPNRHKITYNHIVSEDGSDGFVRIPVDDISKATTTIWIKENLESGVLEAAQAILVGNESEVDHRYLHEGHILFMKAIDLALKERPPLPSTNIRSIALNALQDPNYIQPILALLQKQTPPIQVKSGALSDNDLKAITFLIFEKTENPGSFARTLSQAFQTEPPAQSITHRMFTDILLKRVRDEITLQQRDKAQSLQHRSLG